MTGLTGMRFMQRMRYQAAAVCLALVMAAGGLPPVPLHAQEEPESFSGRYVGFALSDGAVVSLIERDGRVVGQYTMKFLFLVHWQVVSIWARSSPSTQVPINHSSSLRCS